VDGTNSYQIMLDIAAGCEPVFKKGQGAFSVAASCVLRTFENMKVIKAPQPQDIQRVQDLYADVRVESYAVEGAYLHEQDQDTASYRYAIINIGGMNQIDLMDRFAHCKDMLQFKLEPLASFR
jgi:hypothetical protein